MIVEKIELNSLESYVIAITRNSHLRLLWWSQELHHMSLALCLWYLLGLPFCVHSELWHDPKTHISMAKASFRCDRFYLLEEFYETTTQFATLPAHRSNDLETNAEMKCPLA